MADGQIINTQHHTKTHNMSIRNEGNSSTMWQAALLVQENQNLKTIKQTLQKTTTPLKSR